jgi:hypothetical protein
VKFDIRYRLSDINVTEVDEATVFEKSRCAFKCLCVLRADALNRRGSLKSNSSSAYCLFYIR